MRVPPPLILLLLACALTGNVARAQDSKGPGQDTAAASPYTAPARGELVRDGFTETIGPYSLMLATFTAAIHQATDSPPDWHQGAGAFAQRFGSNMGITAVGNITRFGLAAALDQDPKYYRCRCKGFFPRLRHAGLSPLIIRRRSDGAQVFSIPGLVAPYAATTTATYAWYPDRFGAKDAFRMGNYNLLGTLGSDIAYEFVPRAVWRALGKLHLNSRRMERQD